MSAPVLDHPTEDAAAEPEAAPGAHLALVPDVAPVRPRATLRDKLAYARELSQSSLLPGNYRRQPSNVLYAVEYGAMLDLAPMAAITGIHVIDGKPTASAALMSALVRKHGHRLRVSVDPTAMTATAELVRADDPDFTFRSTWTLGRAVTAGLCEIRDGKPWARSRKGEPTPWEKYPHAMLKARAISEVCRDGAEECLLGMHYTPEELGADVDEEGQVVLDAEVVPAGPPIDWDAKITECGGNPEALAALWKTAPRDSEARNRIAAAAAAAGINRKATKDAAPDPDGAVPAEIVDDNPPVERATSDRYGQAAEVVELLLTAANVDEAGERQEEARHYPGIQRLDISGLIDKKAREELSLVGQAVTVEQLADAVCSYVGGNKHAVRRLGAVAEETAGEPETAGEVGERAAAAAELANRISGNGSGT